MCYDISHNTDSPFRNLLISSMDYDLIVVEYGQEGENCVEIISEYIARRGSIYFEAIQCRWAEVASTFSLGDVLEERREK